MPSPRTNSSNSRSARTPDRDRLPATRIVSSAKRAFSLTAPSIVVPRSWSISRAGCRLPDVQHQESEREQQQSPPQRVAGKHFQNQRDDTRGKQRPTERRLIGHSRRTLWTTIRSPTCHVSSESVCVTSGCARRLLERSKRGDLTQSRTNSKREKTDQVSIRERCVSRLRWWWCGTDVTSCRPYRHPCRPCRRRGRHLLRRRPCRSRGRRRR